MPETSQVHLLVIEDDAVIGKSLRKGFHESGYVCQWARDGARGLELARTHQFDAIVLDLMLPETSGLEVLRALRSEGIQTPVLVLTAMGSVEDRVTGLMLGADDYLVKPFAFVELVARIDALRRRALIRPEPLLQLGDLSLDLARRRVIREGIDIELTPTEFSLLEFLMRHAGQVVSRKMLCEHLWDSDWEGTTNVIEVHINRLRGKLNRGFSVPLIHTVRGRGYALRNSS